MGFSISFEQTYHPHNLAFKFPWTRSAKFGLPSGYGKEKKTVKCFQTDGTGEYRKPESNFHV